MTIHLSASLPAQAPPDLDHFKAATEGADAVYISVSGQSMQVLGTGTTPGGRSVAWVAPDVDTTRQFTEALEHRFGIGISQTIVRELGLHPSPGTPLSSRTVERAIDMAQTSTLALEGVDFITQLDCSATTRGAGFQFACRTLDLDPAGFTAQQRQDIDAAMLARFQQAAAQGQSPVAPDTAQAWLRELLHA